MKHSNLSTIAKKQTAFGGKSPPGNGDDGLLVATALLQSQIAAADFRVLLFTDGAESALYQQGLDVSSGPTNSGGFLLSSTLI